MIVAAGPAALRFAVAKLRPKLEPLLAQHSLTWEDAVPALELVKSLEDLKAAFQDPEVFLDKLMASAGPAALRLGVAKLRPKLEPLLAKHTLTWEDVAPALELVRRLEQLEQALEDPETFLEKLLILAGPVALQFAIAKLRPKLEPSLARHHLVWEDILPALELIRSLEDLEDALEIPEAFLDKLIASAGPAALRFTVAKLRPKLEPLLTQHSLTWEDVLPALELVKSVQDLEAALQDPEAFLDKLTRSAGPVARRFLVAKLRPKLESLLAQHSLTWEDAVPALELVKSVEELQAALEDPGVFLAKLTTSVGPVALRLAVAKLQPKLEPLLTQHSLTWADMLPALELVKSLEELQAAVANPEAFLAQLVQSAGPAAVRFAIAQLRPKLEPLLMQYSLTWKDAVPSLELVKSLPELEEALKNPEALLDKLLTLGGPAAVRFAVAKLRPKLEPLLAKHSLTWEDMVPALELVKSLEDLEEALQNPEAFLRSLMASAGPAALRFAVAKLRPRLEPLLAKYSMAWEDAVPALELVKSLEELEEALQDPAVFLLKLMSSAGPAALRFAVAKLRPMLAKHGMTWDEVEASLDGRGLQNEADMDGTLAEGVGSGEPAVLASPSFFARPRRAHLPLQASSSLTNDLNGMKSRHGSVALPSVSKVWSKASCNENSSMVDTDLHVTELSASADSADKYKEK
jgi:fructose-specific component phosphotransferase system IIB-like protein